MILNNGKFESAFTPELVRQILEIKSKDCGSN